MYSHRNQTFAHNTIIEVNIQMFHLFMRDFITNMPHIILNLFYEVDIGYLLEIEALNNIFGNNMTEI